MTPIDQLPSVASAAEHRERPPSVRDGGEDQAQRNSWPELQVQAERRQSSADRGQRPGPQQADLSQLRYVADRWYPECSEFGQRDGEHVALPEAGQLPSADSRERAIPRHFSVPPVAPVQYDSDWTAESISDLRSWQLRDHAGEREPGNPSVLRGKFHPVPAV